MEQYFPIDIANHIRQEVGFEKGDDYHDTPKWMPTTSGRFMVSSAWEILRHRATVNAEYKMLWTKGLPLKISFFEWRLCKGKIPTDDLWKRNSYMVVSKCWCCVQPKEDSFQHLFLSSPTENRVWSTFAQAAGIIDNLVHVHQVI